MFDVPLTHHDACIAKDDPPPSDLFYNLIFGSKLQKQVGIALPIALIMAGTPPCVCQASSSPSSCDEKWRKPFFRSPELRAMPTSLGS